jgi:RNA polymerase sigma factor (sigma-70 family)
MNDEDLVARYLAQRDPADFQEVVERNAANVLRLVSSVLGPFRDTDAEETVQEIFIRVHERLSQFRGEAQFRTWLYRLAYRVAINHARGARFRMPHQGLEVLRSIVAPGDDPQLRALATERAEVVARCLDTLPDLYRTVIHLFYWQDASVAEIAEYLGAPANTVKSYLARARERLRRALDEKGITT